MTKKVEENLICGSWSWIDDEVKLLKKLYPQGNTKMIAEKLCRPFTAVRQKTYDLGLKTNTYNFWTEDDLKLLAKLYPDTVAEELVRRFGRSAGAIKTKARQLGFKKNERYLKAIKSRPRNDARTNPGCYRHSVVNV